MNCEWVQQNITLYLYNELADDARHELEQHMTRCKDCAAEFADQQEFQTQMSALPVEEPSASFLAASRMRLQESLETAEQRSRLVPPFRIRSCGMVAPGAVLAGTGSRSSSWSALAAALAPCTARCRAIKVPRAATGSSQETSIGGITSIEKEPGTDKVKVQYDKRFPSRSRARSPIRKFRTCCCMPPRAMRIPASA